jgi:hypothetical protein
LRLSNAKSLLRGGGDRPAGDRDRRGDGLDAALTTAFSPTDVMPLERWAKLTMMGQSAISLATVTLVVARAIGLFR